MRIHFSCRNARGGSTGEDASGSTSQAANVIEGIEAGTSLFLIDEDTSATNFMVRDELMQRVVADSEEPITPFISRVRDLYEKLGISSILVAGSSGSYFHVADTVIQMKEYVPYDITERAKTTAAEFACAAYRYRTEKLCFVCKARTVSLYTREVYHTFHGKTTHFCPKTAFIIDCIKYIDRLF